MTKPSNTAMICIVCIICSIWPYRCDKFRSMLAVQETSMKVSTKIPYTVSI